jgi:hypothetical protein
MLDTILIYLISLGIIGSGVGFTLAGVNSATSAFWIVIGISLIAVGTIKVLNELYKRMIQI